MSAFDFDFLACFLCSINVSEPASDGMYWLILLVTKELAETLTGHLQILLNDFVGGVFVLERGSVIETGLERRNKRKYFGGDGAVLREFALFFV